MLSTLSGKISSIVDQSLLVDIGFCGFSVSVPNGAAFSPGQEVKLFTYLHWNQENGPSLFGFSSELEKSIFTLILGCSGIGPKIALALLQTMQPSDFLAAIQNNDIKAVSATPGIGAKKAEQIIVQLRHKATKLIDSGIALPASDALTDHQTLQKVLLSLNYSRPEISQALDYVRSKKDESASFDQQVRIALSYLSKQL